MHLLEVIVYLDDLTVFGKTLEENEQRLLKVGLEESGLKLSFDECQFCRSQVTYVGHIVWHSYSTEQTLPQWKPPPDLPSLQ